MSYLSFKPFTGAVPGSGRLPFITPLEEYVGGFVENMQSDKAPIRYAHTGLEQPARLSAEAP